MKIERIDDDTIKFELSRSELKDYKVNKEDIMNNTLKSRKFYSTIMHIAYESCNFNISNANLIIETQFYEGSDEKDDVFIVILKHVSNEEYNKKQASSGIFKNIKKETYFYTFDTIDDIINLSHRLEGNFAHLKSTLYLEKDQFAIILKSDNLTILEKIKPLLNEYGVEVIRNDNYEIILREHGNIITEEDALNKLASL